MGWSISVVTVAFQLQPCALWWLIPMCEYRIPTEQLEIHGAQRHYCITHGTTMALINGNYFIVQSICLKDRCLQRYVC